MTTVRVTEERIAAGTPQVCTLCPVALAMQPLLAAGIVAYVGEPDVIFCDVRQSGELVGSISRLFPDWVRKKIARFDAGGGMEPFEFELDIPSYMLRE